MSLHVPNQYRLREGPMASQDELGNNGAFIIPGASPRANLNIICSDGMGWEHVSVSKLYEIPSWNEMCKVKDLFWDEEDCVVQFHVPKSEHINNHNYCLHLWRKVGVEFELPPSIMVGLK